MVSEYSPLVSTWVFRTGTLARVSRILGHRGATVWACVGKSRPFLDVPAVMSMAVACRFPLPLQACIILSGFAEG